MTISKKNRLGTNVITQIGIVVQNIEQTAKDYAFFFGVPVPGINLTASQAESHTEFRGNPSEGRAKLAFFKFKNITIELIEPVDGPSTWQEYLDTRGEGVHHIAFQINKGEEKTLDLDKLGIPLEQKGDFRGGGYKYFNATESLKIILELLETKLH